MAALTAAAGNPVMHLSAAPHAEPDAHRDRYEFLDSLSPYHTAAHVGESARP